MNTTAHFHSFCTQKSILTWIPLKSAGSSELYAKRIPADFWIYAKTGALTFFWKNKTLVVSWRSKAQPWLGWLDEMHLIVVAETRRQSLVFISQSGRPMIVTFCYKLMVFYLLGGEKRKAKKQLIWLCWWYTTWHINQIDLQYSSLNQRLGDTP